MSDKDNVPKTFKIKFYKSLNAFEIYKCANQSIDDVDINYPLHDNADRWQFNWNDSLIIDWVGDSLGLKHFLKFKRLSSKGKSTRNSPVEGFVNDDCFKVERNQAIKFIESDNEKVEWSFDFFWGTSKDVDVTAINSIDPNAKIRDTPY